jgi:hypothetical protein
MGNVIVAPRGTVFVYIGLNSDNYLVFSKDWQFERLRSYIQYIDYGEYAKITVCKGSFEDVRAIIDKLPWYLVDYVTPDNYVKEYSLTPGSKYIISVEDDKFVFTAV